MMTQQQPQAAQLAPGNPIGYAPIYGPPPLATEAPGVTPPTTQKRKEAPLPVVICAAVFSGTLFALAAWGWAFELYGGADINALQRQVEAANITAMNAEQNAANAEANAQQWQQHAAQQQQTLEQIRELICR